MASEREQELVAKRQPKDGQPGVAAAEAAEKMPPVRYAARGAAVESSRQAPAAAPVVPVAAEGA